MSRDEVTSEEGLRRRIEDQTLGLGTGVGREGAGGDREDSYTVKHYVYCPRNFQIRPVTGVTSTVKRHNKWWYRVQGPKSCFGLYITSNL